MPEEQSLPPSEAVIRNFLEAVQKDQTLSDETRKALVQDLASEDPTKLANLAAIGGKL